MSLTNELLMLILINLFYINLNIPSKNKIIPFEAGIATIVFFLIYVFI
ncbi:hypothetical protein [Liquorilactobacillus hordei]